VNFYWYLSGQPGGDYESKMGLVNPQAPQVETRCTLDIKAGPDKEHLTSLTQIPNAKSRGDQTMTLPAQTNLLEVTITPPADKPAAPSDPKNAPEDYSTPTIVDIPISTEPNLLKNPNLTFSPTSLSVSGWTGLSTAEVSPVDPPRPGGIALEIAANPQMGPASYTASPVPVQPGLSYLLTGWVKGAGQLQFTGLDPVSKTIQRQIRGFDFQSTNRWERICIPYRPLNSNDVLPQMETLGINLVGIGDMQVSGLSLQQWDIPKSATDPGNTVAKIVITTDDPGHYHIDAKPVTKDELVSHLKELYAMDPNQPICVMINPNQADTLDTLSLVHRVGFKHMSIKAINNANAH
jgi:biopolymer transport protein ExbD